jgi:hypothetical protein
LDGIVDKIDQAWKADRSADELLREAKDADAFRKAVDTFLTAVNDAEAAVAAGKEELDRRERERAERRDLAEQLSELAEELIDGVQSVERLAQSVAPTEEVSAAAGVVREALERLPQIREQEDADLDAWRAKVNETATESAAALMGLREAVKAAEAARMEAFNARRQTFGTAKRVTIKARILDRPKTEEVKVLSPAEFVEDQGLGEYKEPLERMAENIQTLKDGGVQRSNVTGCTNFFIKYTYQPKEE